MQDEKERIRRLYEQEAPIYDRVIRVWEPILLGGAREWVGRRAKGEVLEIAVGTGRNLPYYAPDIRLTGIDLSPDMLDLAKHQATILGRDADLRLGDAEQLEFGDESFDTVVCTYSLCIIRAAQRWNHWPFAARPITSCGSRSRSCARRA